MRSLHIFDDQVCCQQYMVWRLPQVVNERHVEKNVRFSRRTWNVPFLVGGFIFSKKHVSKSITASCPKNFRGDKKTCWKPPPTSFFKSWSGLIPLNGGHLSPEKATYCCKQGHNLKNLVMVISDLKLSGRLKTQGRSSRILWWTACKKHVIQMDFYYTTWIYLYLITISIIFIIIVRHHYYHYHLVYRYTYNILYILYTYWPQSQRFYYNVPLPDWLLIKQNRIILYSLRIQKNINSHK